MRNRPETERRILAAARRLLETAGPLGFGINAVADLSSADKVLLYRYFNGADGLLDAIARSTEFFPMEMGFVPSAECSPGEIHHAAILHYARAVEGRPLTRQILLAEAHLGQSHHLWIAFDQARARFEEKLDYALQGAGIARRIGWLVAGALARATILGISVTTLLETPLTDPVHFELRVPRMDSSTLAEDSSLEPDLPEPALSPSPPPTPPSSLVPAPPAPAVAEQSTRKPAESEELPTELL